MAEWGFWEWVAYSALFVAAIILATDQGIKMAPDLASTARGLLANSIWAFTPLALVLIATGILVGREMGWIGKEKAPAIAFAKWPTPYKPIAVFGKTFRNEVVLLDGYSYTNCHFVNVTFKYNGTTMIFLSNNSLEGSVHVISDNPAVDGSYALLISLGVVKNNTVLEVPPGSMVERLQQ
jgi:hypothetical protein